MKNTFKTLITIALIGTSISAVKAQDKKEVKNSVEQPAIKKTSSDTTRLRLGSLKITMVDDKDSKSDTSYKDMFEKKNRKKRKKHVDGYWTGFGLGFNNYLNASGGTTPPPGYDYLELNTGKSINVTYNFFEQSINLYHNNLLLVTGMGLEWNNYRFQKNIALIPDKPTISAYTDTVNAYSKSKLVVDYINIPLILTFRTNREKGKNFHIGAGVIAGYVWSSHTKRKYESDGSKHKDYDDFNVNPFKATATVRIGYGDGFTLYGTYALTNFFKDGQGPILTPYSMGIAFNF